MFQSTRMEDSNIGSDTHWGFFFFLKILSFLLDYLTLK